MSIWEHLESDMSDRDAFHADEGKSFVKFLKSADAENKVFLFIENVNLTAEMCIKPWNNIADDKDCILPSHTNFEFLQLSQSGADIIHLSSDDKHSMTDILPRRACAAYISYFKPTNISSQFTNWLKDKNIRKQLTYLSKENLGFDICKREEYLGNYIFISYNPIYRSIYWREDEHGCGLYFCIHFRKGIRHLLKIKVEAYNSGDFKIFEEHIETNNFFGFISFKNGNDKTFKYLKIYVYDKKGTLIDYFSHLNFVHQVNIDLSIQEKALEVKNKEGKVVRTIEKFRSVKPLQIGNTTNNQQNEDVYNYQKLEEALDFVFIDGDENGEQGNRKKGIDLIQRIINLAKEKCYICDVYFGTIDFEEFIWGASSLNVEIRILTSKLGLPNSDSLSDMQALLKTYNEEIGGNVRCRQLGGNPILHDRLIIADEQVWMLGSSLNHYGAKATTLIRVPQAYRKHLIDKIERLWESNESNELKYESD